MPVPLAYLDGKLIPRDEARLAIHDAGFVFAATVTDFCRTFHQRLYRWADHLERFRHDCRLCGIPLPKDDTDLTVIAHDLVAHNAKLIEPHQELALVTFGTPGPFGYYAGAPGQNGPPTLCLHTIPLDFKGYRWFFEEGIALRVVGSHATADGDLVSPTVKHRSRLHWWRARAILGQLGRSPLPSGLSIALLEDGAGHVTETAIGNLLIVKDGTVLSPPRGQVLDGISLRVVEEICAGLDIPFERRMLTQADCTSADEAMLCGSAFCLAGVRWIQGTYLNWPGALTQRLLAGWGQRVGVDIAAQILSTP
jgi:branched-subunit amino acid aminotransferase/4-amino-4-deoxychorismate lyase